MESINKHPEIRDYGPDPFIFNIDHAAAMNKNFRTTLWTGCNMQLTLMSIPVKGDIGAELHNDTDQFIYVVDGVANVLMGCAQDKLREVGTVKNGYAVIVPKGTWHNIVNVGAQPLKVYSLYAPPHHPRNTVHKTKADAEK